ncbi:TetR/AcrR family transcriptional regulator [Williamsia phyllosphaerae]|uniref:TetR/AcrR family transcriptional regulator n=1 Tax=Williamsia phyllosphaerae TaxID=885042 RepID=UPI001E375DA4|nr:TetR/AcrR family transcriptional regulator [Williamsia phyllosphaerae]
MTVVDTEKPQARAGLRERKKVQTQARLIDVALELCDSQGFDATTVEQISDAADISPRTFNRYFATKEDVILAPIDDMVAAVAAAMDAQPRTGNEFQALLDAHLSVMCGGCPEISSVDLDRFEVMNRIAQSSPSVSGRSAEMGEIKFRRLSEKIAERTGASTDDTQVRVIATVWLSLMHLAMDKLCGAGAQSGSQAARAEALQSTYDAFRVAVKDI